MGFFRDEYWSELPFPPPGDLLHQVIKPMSPAWQVDSLPLSHQGSPNLQYIHQMKHNSQLLSCAFFSLNQHTLLLLQLSHFTHVRLCATP